MIVCRREQGFPDHEEAKKYAEFPMWLHMVERLVRFVNPMSVFRATGAYGIDMFKKLRPDFANRFSDVLDKPDIFYEYIYYSNSFKPRYTRHLLVNMYSMQSNT